MNEVVAIREFIALELIRSRVGVHRIEQLDALLIRHLGRTLRLRTLLARNHPRHAPVRGKAQVAVGRFAARLSHLAGIDHFLVKADQLPCPVEVAFGRQRGKRDGKQ